MAADWQLDCPCVTSGLAVDQCEIRFLNSPIVEIFAKADMRQIVFSDDEQS